MKYPIQTVEAIPGHFMSDEVPTVAIRAAADHCWKIAEPADLYKTQFQKFDSGIIDFPETKVFGLSIWLYNSAGALLAKYYYLSGNLSLAIESNLDAETRN